MSDDWSKVTSKKGKKKTKKISEDTRKKQLADAGLLSSPLDNKPTMYEKFDEEMARKEKAASGQRAADTDTDTDDDTTAARPTSKPKKVIYRPLPYAHVALAHINGAVPPWL